MSMRARLLLTLVPLVAILFLVMISATFNQSREIINQEVNQQVLGLVQNHARQFDALTLMGQQIADNMALALASDPKMGDESIRDLIQNTLLHYTDIYGSTVALLPDATSLGRYAPYYFRGPSGLMRRNLADPQYDYPKWPWFRQPIAQGKGIWTGPYNDQGGGDTLMITYASPIIRRGRVVGVATVDISLRNLVAWLREMKVGQDGFAYLIAASGQIIGPPGTDQRPLQLDSKLKAKLDALQPGQSISLDMIHPGIKKYSRVILTPLESTNAVMVCAYPYDEILGPLNHLRRIIFIIAAGIMILLVLVILWTSRSATAPLLALVKQTRQFAAGNFSARLDASRGMKEIRSLSQAFNVMGETIADQIRELRKTQEEIVYRLGLAAEYRDADTGMHIRRMSQYCYLLARAWGMDAEECTLILQASPMHDIGKIGIPDAILLKPGKLDPAEWEIMKTHPSIGNRILAGNESRLLHTAQIIAYTHHEKWDGSGYPRGLKAEEIPREGRIVAICDVFDSLTSERPYKKAWAVESAMKLIVEGSGKDFDPELVEIFRSLLPELLKVKQKFSDDNPVNHS